MKFGDMTSLAHNLATSVSDGVSFLFGAYQIEIHREAAASPQGHITVDFLTGETSGGTPSDGLAALLRESPAVLAKLCEKNGAVPSEFAVLTARYGVDQVYGPHFLVTVEDHAGRRSEERYAGISGRRLRRGHKAA